MIDVPKDLLNTIATLERTFTVTKDSLKAITNHFVDELQRGLSKEGGSIPMNVTWVMDWPTGKEKGAYLALDMGGTNFRVAEITLDGNRGFDVTQSKYLMPDHLKVGTKDDLFDYIADCVGKFLASSHPDEEITDLSLGFTFSYPCTQPAINRGILQTWTKGFDIADVEGHDVAPMLESALHKKGLPIRVTALINDTTGTLVASNYVDPQTKMGLIFGTGCNAAYYDRIGNIPKLEGLLPDDANISPDDYMAINCEWGAFDNENKILPRTKWDVTIDRESPRPGQQCFEKMISGYYLGELLRRVLCDLYDEGCIFEGRDIKSLRKEYSLDASFLSQIEEDPWENLTEVESLFLNKLGIIATESERKLVRRLAELIGTRSARLSACGVAALIKKTNMESGHCGADGSVFNKYPHFKARMAEALSEIFDWPSKFAKQHAITVIPAEDGSGVGAALIAALTTARIEAGKYIGQKGSS